MSTPRPNFVQTVDDAFEMWRWLSNRDWISFDTETSGLTLYSQGPHVRLLQLGSPDNAWVIDFQKWRGLAEDVFSRFEGEFIAHNSRFDVTALKQEGIDVNWAQVHDTMIMLRLAEPTERAGLKEASDRYVSRASSSGQKTLAEAFRRQKWTFGTVPLDFNPYLYYSALDTVLTARLFETDVARRGRASPMYSTEMQVKAVCCRMEQNGMKIDRGFCATKASALRMEADDIKARVAEEYDFALASTQQLAHWFASQPAALERMTKETGGGGLSVDKEVLLDLAMIGGKVGAIAKAALVVRRNEKLAGSYLENFLSMSDGDDLVHPQIETVAARTGRMSVREPGLQTLPKPTVDSDYRIVREAVIPNQPDHVLVSCDSDQIELRLTASLSRDHGLIQAFKNADESGIDFFTMLARGVYGNPDMDKAHPLRNRIKTFTYASLYGAGLAKMAWSAGVPVHEMREVRDDIAARYPGFFSMSLEAQHEVKTNGGYIDTAYGRRLPVNMDKPYVATNYKIQGTAADVLKISLVNMAQAGLDEFMIVPVHDEVLFSIPADMVDEVRPEIKANMECHDFAVTLTATPSDGVANWADAK